MFLIHQKNMVYPIHNLHKKKMCNYKFSESISGLFENVLLHLIGLMSLVF